MEDAALETGGEMKKVLVICLLFLCSAAFSDTEVQALKNRVAELENRVIELEKTV